MLEVGSTIEVTVSDVAHGGFGIARHDGVVVFIRGTDIGERLVVEITKIGSKRRFVFAEITEVLKASSNRTNPPCHYAGVCGGCDFQHITTSHQRELKKRVVLNSLEKFAGIDASLWSGLEVQEMHDLHYRTRMHYQSTPLGDFGLFRTQSSTVVLIEDCKIAASEISLPRGEIGVVADDFQGFIEYGAPRAITQVVGTYVYQLDSQCFWQAHRDAPERFIEIVMRFADIQNGESVWDLYAGVGLFTLPSADFVGSTGSVTAVEGDKRSSKFLTSNTSASPQVHTVKSDVETWVESVTSSVDVVILDPPRKGAGKSVMHAIAKKQPRSIVYVACDPVALSRDIGIAKQFGYELSQLEAVDAYPQTHHVETFALLVQARINVEEKA